MQIPTQEIEDYLLISQTIEEKDFEEIFSKEVQKLIKDGYQPLGGISVRPSEYNSKTVILQVMVKYKSQEGPQI